MPLSIRTALGVLIFALFAACKTTPHTPPPTTTPRDTAAATVTFHLTWTIPTQRTDGAALPVEEISGYDIVWTVDDDPYQTFIVQGGATTSHDIVQELPARAEPYTIVFEVSTIDSAHQVSDPSQSVTITVTAGQATPCAPPTVHVEATCTAGKCEIGVTKIAK